MTSSSSVSFFKLWIIALGGMLFAAIVWKIMSLEFRYAVAASGGLVVLLMAMMARSRIDDFLIYLFIFNIPFAALEKWLFLQNVAVSARGINLGLSELLLLIAYIVWFAQIFILKSAPLPKLGKLDYCIIGLLLVQAASTIGAPNKALGLFDIIYNVKHVLIYFFLLHKINKKHLKTILLLFLFAILLESGLACYERISGNVGIGLSKGNTQSDDYGAQYNVPGLDRLRAAGSTSDSHTLALYYAMLLPVPLVFAAMRNISFRMRLAMMSVLLAGLAGLIATYSRSGWFSFAIAGCVAIMVIALVWKQRIVIPLTFAAFAVVIMLYPNAVTDLYDRIFEAPQGIMDARYETYRTALDILQRNPVVGYGPGNYIDALNDPEILQQTVKGGIGLYYEYDIPVHNSYLWVASELGILGFIAFFSIPALLVSRCIRHINSPDIMLRGFALAALTAVIAYLLDGLTGPMFRDSVPYTQLWVYAAIMFAFQPAAKGREPLLA